ncbi:MAG: hypothetical protein Q8O72_01240 [Bacteroidales bacterium]|nr:hypothetical protein [Bacteroidales bacterium]
MVNIKRLAFLTLVLLWTLAATAQEIGIGEWRTHLPYSNVIDVALVHNTVYAATPYSMFIYNQDDNSLSRFDKVKGLSDVGINKIAYNPTVDALMVAYSNANLDLVYPNGSVVNISDIRDKEILGNKTINNILIKDKYAYLSCGFGVVVVDMNRIEIADTWYIGPEGNAIDVMDLTFNDTAYFAATESGIYFAEINAPNLADFQEWTKDNRLKYPNLKYNLITSFSGKIFTNYSSNLYAGDTMFVYDGTAWDYFDRESNGFRYQFNAVDNKLLVVKRGYVDVYDHDLVKLMSIYKPSDQTINPLSATAENDTYWIGDAKLGLAKVGNNGWSGEYMIPNGPGTKNIFDLDCGGLNVWVAPGGHQSNWGKSYMTDGIFSSSDGNWTTHNRANTPELGLITDFVTTKVDPNNPDIAYVGSWGGGLVKFVNHEFNTLFDKQNSSLRPWLSDTNNTLISGLDFDSNHNLWVANSGAGNLVSVMKNNGDWKSYNLGGALSGADISELIVDDYNQKWMIKRADGFIIVFSDNNTLDDTSDDHTKILNSATGTGHIAGNKVYSFATDLDGEVWVGTDKGVSVFYSPENIFVSGVNYDAQQILVPRNDGSGLADILLETELVTAITVDGANRKWIGTERTGVFLISPDGLEEIHHFTAENSPLLSNQIISIGIDQNGEVYIGTGNGLISYRSSATPPNPPGTKVYAYPNPVREDYHGDIAIKGLVSDSFIKITDTYGNLVYQTKSEGGQAVWNGKNFDGRDAATGVYMVFAFTADKSEKLVTKILVVR